MIKLKDVIELLEKELEEKYNFKKQSCTQSDINNLMMKYTNKNKRV